MRTGPNTGRKDEDLTSNGGRTPGHETVKSDIAHSAPAPGKEILGETNRHPRGKKEKSKKAGKEEAKEEGKQAREEEKKERKGKERN